MSVYDADNRLIFHARLLHDRNYSFLLHFFFRTLITSVASKVRTPTKTDHGGNQKFRKKNDQK